MATTVTTASQTESEAKIVSNSDHSTRRPTISKLKLRFQDAISHSPLNPQPTHFARRLQALLPSTAPLNNAPAAHVSTPPAIIEPTSAPNDSPFIKIRIITWNMHESLPKGDLDALLGVVPRYTPKGTAGNTLNIEGLSMDASHPYHIVVILSTCNSANGAISPWHSVAIAIVIALTSLLVMAAAFTLSSDILVSMTIIRVACCVDTFYSAGQECPTLMGLPLGLGGGFKWSKEDDEKEKEHKEKEGHRPKSTKDKEKDKDLDLEKDERRHSSEHGRTLDAPLQAITSTPTPSLKEKEKEKEHHTMGWSAILEDYFSRGIGSVDSKPVPLSPAATPSTPKQGSSSSSTTSPSSEHLQPPACPARSASSSKDGLLKVPQSGHHVPRLGPYELITKERMMGLYLAVYVHRDSGELVHGHSKSAVTAGLIGGRLGNKGGVGISLNFNGTSFLFINAHLAAHGGRKAHRLANMAKIKAELTVDPFLQPDDPRTVAEDITDRFDHTFIFGDLNFRLDVTRLHADWLVSRQAFAQAQEFDQLRQIMKRGEAFVGFNEGPINFPPTFKYDVLRTIKQRRSPKANSSKHTLVLSEVEEKTDAHGSVEDEHEQEGGDSVSVLSSAWASGLSRRTSRSSSSSSESGKTKEKDKEIEIAATNARLNANGSPSSVSGILQVAHKTKAKWLNLVHISSPSKELDGPLPPSSAPALVTRAKSLTRRFSIKKPQRSATLAESKVQSVEPNETLSTHHAVTSSTSVPAGDGGHTSASLTAEDTPRKSTSSLTTDIVKGSSEFVSKIAKNVSRSPVTRRGHHNRDEQTTEVLSKGIYDSSSKQRVPSWCDRILYKSTVIPPPDPEPDPAIPPLQESTSGLLRSSQRVGQFLANAFKTRNGRESVSSVSTTATNPPGVSPNGSPVLDLERRGSGPRGRQKPLPAIPVPMAKSSESGASVPFSASGHTVHTNNVDSHSRRRSTDPVHGRSAADPSNGLLPKRSASGPLPAIAAAMASSAGIPALPMPELDPQPMSPSAGPRRWFSLQFLSVIHNLHTSPGPIVQTQKAISPVPPLHRKGDMVCIAYETLSDKEMRRLEGRSDHRPVVGHYAVFV